MALGAAALLVGCTAAPGGAPVGPTTTGAAASAPTASAAPSDPVLRAIRAGLDPNTAAGALAAAQGTRVTEVPVAGLTGWTVYDLVGSGRPAEIMVALARDGRVLRLSNAPAGFVTISQGALVPDAAAAVTRAADFLRLSRDLQRLSYQVDAVGDVKWLGQRDADQEAIRQTVLTTYGPQIKAPTATATADGWDVVVWRVEDSTDLVRHRVSVTATGGLTDTSVVLLRNLPAVVGLA